MLNEATEHLKIANRTQSKVIHDLKMAELVRQQAQNHLDHAEQLGKLHTGDSSDVLDHVAAVAARKRSEAATINLAAERIETAAGNTSANLADQILAAEEPAPAPRDPFARLKQ